MNQIGAKNDKTHYYGASVHHNKIAGVDQNEKLRDNKQMDEEDFLKQQFLRVDFRTTKFNKKDEVFK